MRFSKRLQEQKDTNSIPKDGLSTSMVEIGLQFERFMESLLSMKKLLVANFISSSPLFVMPKT